MSDGERSQARLIGSAAAPEALLVCPECRTTFRPGDFETHLRRSHRIYLFRGIRRSFNDTFAALLEALVLDRPDAEAWRTLSAIAVEDHGSRADVFLAMILGQLLTRVAPERQGTVLDALGALIGRGGATGLAMTLASDAEIVARQLGLLVLANLPQPIDRKLLGPLYGLLLDRRLSETSQFAGLAAVLRTVGDDRSLAKELLQTLVSGLGKAKSIERLRRFEQYAGPHPAIDALCEKLEDRLRMTCPRCDLELRRAEMVEHLWNEHRLILEGRRVREPWTMLEEWLDQYRQGGEAELLERGRELVQQLDADEGPSRFQRMLLSRGIADEEARRALTERAAEEHSACCPWCYGLVPVPREVPPLRLNQYRGRLSAGGYRVEVSEGGMLTFLEIVTPQKRIYRGRERGQLLTRRGAMFLFVGPLVVLALVGAFGIPPPSPSSGVWRQGPLLPVSALLILALVVHGLTRWLWRPRLPADVRARNYAWTMLAPRLHADGYSLDDSAFLAGLADVSCADAYGPLRAALLMDLAKRTENALAMGIAPPGHLASLRRLMVEDAIRRGAEPLPLIVDLLARCFGGRWSLRFAEQLLAGWESSWKTPANLARLRILLCDHAFEAGFEVRNLLDAGHNAPTLGRVLGTPPFTPPQEGRLAALRLLWSLRPTRPWDRCGEAVTVFDLADDPQHGELLAAYPDLLLWRLEPDWPVAIPGDSEQKPASILFCVRGVALQGVFFTETPRVVEVNARWRYNDLRIGDRRFRSSGPLDMLALRMERWFRYAFSEFLPALPRVEKWRAPDRLAILRAWGAVTCPECHRQLLPRVGQVGIALEEEKTT